MRYNQEQLSQHLQDNANWLDDMNRAIAYLEEHLCQADIEHGARMARRMHTWIPTENGAQYIAVLHLFSTKGL